MWNVSEFKFCLHVCLGLSLRTFRFFQASYGVEDPEFAITQLAQTTMRSEVGKINLDTVFKEREQLNICIVGEFWNNSCRKSIQVDR